MRNAEMLKFRVVSKTDTSVKPGPDSGIGALDIRLRSSERLLESENKFFNLLSFSFHKDIFDKI